MLRWSLLLCLSFACGSALAGVPAAAGVIEKELASPALAHGAAEADQLGKTLTPVGAEAAGTADGRIGAWLGRAAFSKRQIEITRAELEKLRKTNPKAIDDLFRQEAKLETVRETITRANLAQYAEVLTEGHKALFKLYPGYRMQVYDSYRTAFFPDEIYAATKLNATRATLAGTDGVQKAELGFPFPIPKSGAEVIWNHKLKYAGNAIRIRNDAAVVAQDGSYRLAKVVADVEFEYANLKKRKRNTKLSLYYLARALSPPRIAGQVVLVHETADQSTASRVAWIFDPGVGRVRRAPDVGFDNPSLGSDGELFNDQVGTFNGSLERYDWKLIGKKPMLIPYNSRRMQLPTIKFADILKKGHINQIYPRYELHRVWIVEATLRSGQRHQLHKRRFYVDEDSWAIAAVDGYDARGQLWKFQEPHLTSFPFIPTTAPNPEIVYDLLAGRYYATGLVNENEYSDWQITFPANHFQPQGLPRLATED